ncbi:hypothetical protein JTB14_024210 [Gonioctena quinquepunctata]|nr:hypothetical protein JTB14_024210 [Gonioctena quinquepunctata]
MMFPVFLFVIASVISGGYSAPQQNTTIREHCIEETGISEQKVTQMENQSKKDMEPDEEMMCYAHCVFVSKGVIDENGKFDMEKFAGQLNEDHIDKECVEKLQIVECTDMAALNDCAKK